MKILLAEDDVFTLTILQGYLEENGYDVVTVTNGGEALNKLENETGFDLILSDIFMPVVSGIMMGNLVRQFYFSTTPVILFSGTDNAAVRRAANLAGADGFLPKPISKDRLLKTISDIQNKGRRQASS
ncbi:MAG: response regulator [Sphingobacteriales bacterium JAD_PAG50586_3]|nr:MAG: response regulator [Sphingobacteriales bacterium JAD_PAG50586_3]